MPTSTGIQNRHDECIQTCLIFPLTNIFRNEKGIRIPDAHRPAVELDSLDNISRYHRMMIVFPVQLSVRCSVLHLNSKQEPGSGHTADK